MLCTNYKTPSIHRYSRQTPNQTMIIIYDTDDEDENASSIFWYSDTDYNSDKEENQTDEVVLQSNFVFKSNINSAKQKGVDRSCIITPIQGLETRWRYNPYFRLKNGEPSCRFCAICVDAKPEGSMRKGNKECEHYFCEGCVKEYVAERIQGYLENGAMKCPETDCKKAMAFDMWVECLDMEVIQRCVRLCTENQQLALLGDKPTRISVPTRPRRRRVRKY